jgi:hypothetical protein
MSIYNGPTDRQPNPHSAGFSGVESLENALEMFRIDTSMLTTQPQSSKV